MYTAISSNKRKTVILLAIFIAFISTLGYIFGAITNNPTIFYYIGIGSLVYAAISYYFSAKIALSMSRAKAVDRKQAPELYKMLEHLSASAKLPMPKVYIINDASPNAFATGRNPKNAAVAVTSGLLEKLSDKQVEGVLAHEMAHVGNYDIRLMSVVAALVSVVSIISDFFFWSSILGDDDAPNPVVAIAVMIIAPMIAIVIQLAISRRREYLADATGAMISKDPAGLADALEKISHSHLMRRGSSATAHLYIASPFGKGRGVANLFSTHPPAEDRIRRLRDMEGRV